MEQSPGFQSVQTEETLPWTMREIWLGIAGVALISVIAQILAFYWQDSTLFLNVGTLVIELLYGLPVLVILLIRKTTWETFGLRAFNVKYTAIGCGMIFGAYAVIIIHNMLLMYLGQSTQGTDILNFFSQIDSPGWILFTGAIVAPLVEESFFRGFVFAGMREKWGWKTAAFVSSAIFAVFHFSLAALIPTFLLGLVFAVLYQQAKSIWPSIILHFSINACSLTLALMISKLVPVLDKIPI